MISRSWLVIFCFFNDTATTEIYTYGHTLSLHDALPIVATFREALVEALSVGGGRRMTVTVLSFAFRGGLPREADLVFDVRFVDNPHYRDELRPLDGRDPAVAAHVGRDPDFAPFMARLEAQIGRAHV